MATTTLPSAARLAIVVVARDLATSTLSRISMQTFKLSDSIAAVSKQLQNMGIAWTGAFVMGGTAVLGATKTFADLETAVTMAVKRSNDILEDWKLPKMGDAVEVAMHKIQGIAAETGVSGEEIADSLNTMIAAGFKASFLLGDVGDKSAESAEGLMYITKAAKALGYSSEDMARTLSQIINIYSAAEKLHGGLTTSFGDTTNIIKNFSKENEEAIRGVLDELNYVTNTMLVDLDDIQQAFQYAGGSIITSGTSLEDMLATISQLLLTGIAPGRIGRFFRTTSVTMDELAVSTEKWAKGLIKAFGLKDDIRKFKFEERMRKQLDKEAKEYLEGQKHILRVYNKQLDTLQRILTNARMLKDIKTAKSMQDLNKSTIRALKNAGFLADEIQQIARGGDQAVAIIRDKYLKVQRKVAEQQEVVNKAAKEGAVSNVQVFRTQLQLVSEVLKTVEGIDWKPPAELVDKLGKTDNMITKWEIFRDILQNLHDTMATIPSGEEKFGAIQRILMQGFFGKRWADLGVIIMSQLDTIKDKAKEIAEKSKGSVEEEFGVMEETLAMKWSKFIESAKLNFLDLWDSTLKPMVEDLIEKLKVIFTDEEVKAFAKEFFGGFLEGVATAIDKIAEFANKLKELGILSKGGVRGAGKLIGLGLFGGPALMFGGTALGFISNIARGIGLFGGLAGRMVRGITGSIGGAATTAATGTTTGGWGLSAIFRRAWAPPPGFSAVIPEKGKSFSLAMTPFRKREAPKNILPPESAEQTAQSFLSRLYNAINRGYTRIGSGILNLFRKAVGWMGGKLGPIFAPLRGALGGVFTRIFSTLTRLPLLGGLVSKLTGAFSGLGGALSTAGGALGGFLSSAASVATVIGIIIAAVTTLIGVFAGVFESISALSGGTITLNTVLQTLVGILQTIGGVIMRVLNFFFQLGRWVGVTLVHGIYNMIQGFQEFISQSPVLLGIVDTIAGFFRALGGAISWVWDKIMGFIDWITGKLKESADSQLEEMKKAGEGVKDKIGNAAIEAKEDVDELYKTLDKPAPEPDVGPATGALGKIQNAAKNAEDAVISLYGKLGLLQQYEEMPETILGRAMPWSEAPGARYSPSLTYGAGIPGKPPSAFEAATKYYPWRGHRGAGGANININVYGLSGSAEEIVNPLMRRLRRELNR